MFIFSHLARAGDEGVWFLGSERTWSEYFSALIVLQAALGGGLFSLEGRLVLLVQDQYPSS